MENPGRMVWTDGHYRVGQKCDTSRTLHYIVREVSLFLAHPVYQIPICSPFHSSALPLAPVVSALQLLKYGTLSLQFFECALL